MTLSAADAIRLLANDLRTNPNQFMIVNIIGTNVSGGSLSVSATGGAAGSTTTGMTSSATLDGNVQPAGAAETAQQSEAWADLLETLAVAAEEGTGSSVETAWNRVASAVPSVIAAAAKLFIENLAS
ncbi:hypothetical protein NYS48_09805 [Curtobacterium flaccumfaciens pv. flaccumfaciens]|uniref:hypothetical protein n=1 Tax=Curtobacterium poinsettiae TaxID=159612 RepID=UPI00217D4C74|nr:hypothetical protein [Curtobacterium flaccumfaciens]MCS6565607.1 hypothetical protein [Curtobacterium flaccumfaciens pv. flaccumfaciens]